MISHLRELIFRPSTGKVYEGRVVHGASDLPFGYGFVMAYSGTVSKGQLWNLTAQEWDVIYQFDWDEDTREMAFERLRKSYDFQCMVRTDDRGFYSLGLDPGQDTHSLVFFAEGVVPFTVPVHQLAADRGMPVQLPDVRLYPAAFVTVVPQAEPVHDGHVSVMPRWIIDPDKNPTWAVDMLPWGQLGTSKRGTVRL